MSERLRGIVKFFNPEKGFGFVTRDDGQGDVFVHISDVKSSGVEEIDEGDRVEFDLGEGKKGKGKKAIELKLLPMAG
jgi:CspA family cold shock protein